MSRTETLKKYNAKPEVILKKKEWYQRNKKSVNSRILAYNLANPEVRKATALRYHYKKYFGLKDIPIKQPCVRCDSTYRLHLHHIDGNNGRNGKPFNNQPNNLAWLCNPCHALVHNHGKIRELV